MLTHFKNRLLLTSLALAAAGILTCVACLLDVYLPRGSLVAFLGWLFTAGVAIVAIMVSFAWTCEKVDDKNRTRQRQAEHYAVDWSRAVTSARGGRAAVLFDRSSRTPTLPDSPRLRIYPMTLRGAAGPSRFDALRTRHGQ